MCALDTLLAVKTSYNFMCSYDEKYQGFVYAYETNIETNLLEVCVTFVDALLSKLVNNVDRL